MSIPAGFEPLPTSSPFNTFIGPLYCRPDGDALIIGLSTRSHCNREPVHRKNGSAGPAACSGSCADPTDGDRSEAGLDFAVGVIEPLDAGFRKLVDAELADAGWPQIESDVRQYGQAEPGLEEQRAGETVAHREHFRMP